MHQRASRGISSQTDNGIRPCPRDSTNTIQEIVVSAYSIIVLLIGVVIGWSGATCFWTGHALHSRGYRGRRPQNEMSD